MADDLKLARTKDVEHLLSEVLTLYEPMACRGWLEWGGEVLFAKFKAEVEETERKLEELRKREEEERAKEAAAEVRAAGFRERRQALAEARRLVLGEYRAKTVSKEGLQAKNAEFEAEAEAIEREELGGANGGEVGESDGKRKAGEGENGEGPVVKRARFDGGEPHQFEGPVSVLFFVFGGFVSLKICSVINARVTKCPPSASSSQVRGNAASALSRTTGATGRG
jgi:hypothetical protein